MFGGRRLARQIPGRWLHSKRHVLMAFIFVLLLAQTTRLLVATTMSASSGTASQMQHNESANRAIRMPREKTLARSTQLPSAAASECFFNASSQRSTTGDPPSTTATTEAKQAAQDFCDLTNPSPTYSNFIHCTKTEASRFHVVVTMTEEELLAAAIALSSEAGAIGEQEKKEDVSAYIPQAAINRLYVEKLAWLDAMPMAKTLYIKSNLTKSFRSSGLQWPAGLQETLGTETMFSECCEKRKQTTNLEEGTLGRQRQIFKSIARRVPFRTCVVIKELPNVGDEALSITSFISNNYIRLEMQQGQQRPSAAEEKETSSWQQQQNAKYVVFIHGHRESWHALDVVEQLKCLCMDGQDRYKTLTSSQKAFFLQCMPLVDVVGKRGGNQRETNRHDNSDDFSQLLALQDEARHWAFWNFSENLQLLPHEQQRIKGLPQQQQDRLRRYILKQRQGLFNVSWRFSKAYEAIFLSATSTTESQQPVRPQGHQDHHEHHGGDEATSAFSIPEAIIRDCCTSFVVSAEAILSRPHRFYKRLDRMIRSQPNPSLFPMIDGDMSMYLERFWRTIFQPTMDDLHRDLTHLNCEDQQGQGGQPQQTRFECPVNDVGHLLNISLPGALNLPWRNRRCRHGSNNEFGGRGAS